MPGLKRPLLLGRRLNPAVRGPGPERGFGTAGAGPGSEATRHPASPSIRRPAKAWRGGASPRACRARPPHGLPALAEVQHHRPGAPRARPGKRAPSMGAHGADAPFLGGAWRPPGRGPLPRPGWDGRGRVRGDPAAAFAATPSNPSGGRARHRRRAAASLALGHGAAHEGAPLVLRPGAAAGCAARTQAPLAMPGGAVADGVAPGAAPCMRCVSTSVADRAPAGARAEAWTARQCPRGVRHVESSGFGAAGKPGVLGRLRGAVGWCYN